MNIIKLSMSNQYFTDAQLKELRDRKMVSIHPETSGKGISNTSQGEHFLQAARGDLVYVCVSNYRIEYIGIFTDDMPLNTLISGHEGWVERSIEILLEPKNPSGYDTTLDKWWAPRNNSTCIPVPTSELRIFESKILSPVFSINLQNLEDLRKKYLDSFSFDSIRELAGDLYKMSIDQSALYSSISTLDDLTIRKLHYRYESKSEGPVNTLRKQVLDMLLNGQKNIDTNTVVALKKSIGENYQTDAYKSWKNDFNLLFPLVYDQHRQRIKDKLNALADMILVKLDIKSVVDKTIFDFYGPRNQGSTGAWIALYNKRHKSQKHAKQLFVRFYDNGQFEFGLYNELLKDRTKLVQATEVNLESVFTVLQDYVSEIESDKEDPMQEKINECIELLEGSGNLVLTGAPGTGKTFLARKIAQAITSDEDRIKFIQFHPSYDYTDFVEGIKPKGLTGGIVNLQLTDGIFMAFCKKAMEKRDQKFVFIIDEINRSDLSRVFGEVFSALEIDYRDHDITTQYSYLRPKEDQIFTIPENVFIIGTMNDIDRSVESMDFALRRRFVWKEITAADSEVIIDNAELDQDKIDTAKKRMRNLNAVISAQMGSNAYQIGGAYFKKLEMYQGDQNCFDILWRNHLKIVLSEYVRGMPHGPDILVNMEKAYNVIN